MPRFYFHLRNDLNVPDQEGLELGSLEAAKAHALRQARFTFAKTAEEEGRVSLGDRIDVEDEQVAVVAVVYFRDAVVVEG